MKKIKLLVVTPYFYPDAGGVSNHTYNLYRLICKKGFDVIVITSNSQDKGYKEEYLEGMKIYRLPRQFKISNTPISFKWKKQIKQIIEKEQPDIINAHTPVPFISDVACKIANKMNIPFIIKYHHGGSMIKGKFPIDIIIWLYEKIFLNKLLNNSNYIITSSDFVTKGFMSKYNDKSISITPGVDIEKFKPINIKTRDNILFVGNLKKSEDYKGLNYLFETLFLIKKKINEIKLVIIGDGDYRKHYEDLARNFGLEKNIKFRGELNGMDLVKEYTRTNVLVLPSLKESFGMVLIEAMACKKPVIGSNIGGIPYVIDDGINGLLVHPKDSQALAEAIIKILENPKLAKKMGEAGYKKVKENFTWDISVEATKKIIKKVIKEQKKK